MKIVQMSLIVLLAMMTVGFAYKPGTKVGWDAVTTDVAGNPEVVVGAEVGAFTVGNVVPVATVAGVDPAGTGWVIDPLMEPLADGSYQVKVRVIDEAGNISEWSDPVDIRVDKTPPSKPGGCRLFR